MSTQTNNQARAKAINQLAKILVESKPGPERKTKKNSSSTSASRPASGSNPSSPRSKKVTESLPRPAPTSAPKSRGVTYIAVPNDVLKQLVAEEHRPEYATGPLPFLKPSPEHEYADVAPLTDEQIRYQEGLEMRELKPAPKTNRALRGALKAITRFREGKRKLTENELKEMVRARKEVEKILNKNAGVKAVIPNDGSNAASNDASNDGSNAASNKKRHRQGPRRKGGIKGRKQKETKGRKRKGSKKGKKNRKKRTKRK